MKNSIINQYPDLKKYRRNGILTPFLFTAIYEILFIVLIIFLNLNNLFVYSFLFYAILVIIGLLPIILFKPFNFLFDKDYKGIIKSIKYKEEIDATSNVVNNNRVLFTKDRIDIQVMTSSEKCVSFFVTCDNSEMKNFQPYRGYGLIKAHLKEPLIDYYKIGDEIEHISGFRFNRKLNLKPNDKNICIVCGTLNQSKDDCCINCGHSIIK